MKIGKEDVLDVEEVVDPQILKRDGNNKNDTEGKANGRRNEKREFLFILDFRLNNVAADPSNVLDVFIMFCLIP